MRFGLKLTFKKLIGLFVALFVLLLVIPQAYAATGINRQVNFQGKLVDGTGVNVADSTYSVVFTLYDASSGGNNLWSETQSVTTTNGIFQVALGSVTSLAAVNLNSDSLYLGIKVSTDAEMTPRVRFAAVPYAFNADKLNGVTATQSATGFSLQGGSSSLSRVAFTTSGSTLTMQPDLAGGLTLQSNGANTLILDAGGAAGVSLGATNANAVSIGTAANTTTINGGLTLTTGKTLTVNGDAFTDLTGSGLVVTSNALTVGLQTGSGIEESASGLSLSRSCSDQQILKWTAGTTSWGCGTDNTGSGGSGGGSNWTLDTTLGVLRPNNNGVDVLFGGTSTASADFVFGNLNSGIAVATFSGNLVMNSRANSSLAQQQTWTKVSGAAGTIGGGATTGIASVSASTVFNGSLYVGTATINNQAEVYRYNGAVQGTWTKVSNATAGTIASGGTAGIASVSAMTVFDGFLYAGTSKAGAAEIYKYDGTNWSKVSQATAGTIRSGGTAGIDGVTAMAVYNGKLYAGTKAIGKAELYRYDGGTTWSIVNTTPGTFVSTNSVAVDAVTSMVTKGGFLYLGTSKSNNAADVLRFNGGVGSSVFTKMNNTTSGTFTLASGSTITAVSEVTAMTVYNGSVVVGLRKGSGAADILTLSDGPTTGDFWTRLGAAAGTVNTGGTASIDSASALVVYNGRLYAGTWKPTGGEIYRFETIGTWTKVSQAIAGQIAPGGTTGIYGVSILQPNNTGLYAMTSQFSTGAEVYYYESYLDQSYALTFRAAPGLAGGVQNNLQEEASIFFLASSSAIANNKGGQNGVFVFSNSIVTRNGAYDVAEDYPTRDDTLEAGDLVSIDDNEREFVKKSSGRGDTLLIGVYSEKPALRLSQDDATVMGARTIPVALAGRVPVKVSTENGEIKPGDYLTASSVPGVAMKATKTGNVIGQAMAGYTESGIGKITVYVKSNSYNGTTADLLTGIDTTKPNFENDILTKLAAGQPADGFISEVNTDRVVAGLEIVAPKIYTDELFAKKIKADEIEGLDALIAQKLGQQLATPSALASSSGESLPIEPKIDVLAASISAQPPIDGLTLNSLSVDGLATISSNLRVKNNSLIEGMLTVVDTLMTKNLIVSGLSTFLGDVVLKGNISFIKPPVFSKDTAGIAVIKAGSDHVDVIFANEYASNPVVNAVLTSDGTSTDQQAILAEGYSYLIINRSTKGFTILLNKLAKNDLNLSWIAIMTN